MNEKKKARPGVGAPGQAERESHWTSGNSREKHTISAPRNQWKGEGAAMID